MVPTVVFFTLFALYPAWILLVTITPERCLGPLVPWGGGRLVAVHPSHLDALRGTEGPAGYRRSARGTVVGHRVRMVLASVRGPALGEFGGTVVLEPLSERRALLVMRSWLGVVHHRAVFVAEVTDDGGGARVRARVVTRLAPALVVGFCGALSALLDGHLLAMLLGGPFLISACVSLLRLWRCLHWAREEIARALEIPRTGSAACVSRRPETEMHRPT
jgi:hypothetical protein